MEEFTSEAYSTASLNSLFGKFLESADHETLGWMFSSENRNWFVSAANSLAINKWTTEDFIVLRDMAEPVGGIEEFAKIFDEAMSHFPHSRSVSNSFNQVKRSTVFKDPRGLAAVFQGQRNRLIPNPVRSAAERYSVSYEDQRQAEEEISQASRFGHAPITLSLSAKKHLQWLLLIGFTLFTEHLLERAAEAGFRHACNALPSSMQSEIRHQFEWFLADAVCQNQNTINPLVNIDVRTVKGTSVNLRTGPSLDAPIVPVSLADRDFLQVFSEREDGWIYVAVLAMPGVKGWISGQHVHKSR